MQENNKIITLKFIESEDKLDTIYQVKKEQLETKVGEQIGLATLYEHCNCDLIEYGSVLEFFYRNLGFEPCLIFDEEFLLTHAPKANPIASLLYGCGLCHETTLCGNVIIAKNAYNKHNELYTTGFTTEEVNKLMPILRKLYDIADTIKFKIQEPCVTVFCQ